MADSSGAPSAAAAVRTTADDGGATTSGAATATTTQPYGGGGGGLLSRFRRTTPAGGGGGSSAGASSAKAGKGKGKGGKAETPDGDSDSTDGSGDVVDAGDLPGLVLPRRPNPLSRLLFLFVDPLIYYGYHHTLGPGELYKPPAVETEQLYGRFDAAWQAQRAGAAKGGKKPDIKVAVFRGSSGGLLFTGVLYAISTACSLVGPMMLRNVVNGLSCQSAAKAAASAATSAAGAAAPPALCPTRTTLYLYLIALCGAPLIQSLSENQMNFALNVIGTRMRNALMAAIYRKCLRLTNAALQAESGGRVVTLMSNDAQKVQDAMLAIHTAWGAPALIVVILALLYQQVGWATFVGLAVMLVYTPLTAKVSAKLLVFRRSMLKWTDRRVGLMNELIAGMQMVKLYAWEDSFRDEVEKARGEEVRTLKAMIKWQALFAMLLFSGPVAVAVFCFGSFALAGRSLSTGEAYAAVALFNLLRLPLAFLPMLVTMLINAAVALKRIQGFLMRPEVAVDADGRPVLGGGDPRLLLRGSGGDGGEADGAADSSGAAAPDAKERALLLERLPVGTVRVVDGEFDWGAPPPGAAPAVAVGGSGKGGKGKKKGKGGTQPLKGKGSSSDSAAAAPAAAAAKQGGWRFFGRGGQQQALPVSTSAAVTPGAKAAPPPLITAAADDDAKAVAAAAPIVVSVGAPEEVPAALGADDGAGSSSSSAEPPAAAAAAAGPDSPAAASSSSSGSSAKAAFCLRDVQLDAPPGSLTMIVGAVGSGKSSLLAALVGLMERNGGAAAMRGTVALVSQTAWIVNDTVQANVLLGAPFDAARYRAAVEAAQLAPDLDVLPQGDATEIGDRGVTLSGGQKQRVSIARAVYADADVVLMDDPLSAVDAHVGRALFERCIKGAPLRGKTVLLVTNALQYLPHADNVVWMDGGRIRAQGTYAELVRDAGLDIKELVHMEEDGEGERESEGEADAREARERAAADAREAQAVRRDEAKAAAAAKVAAADRAAKAAAGGGGKSVTIVEPLPPAASQPPAARRGPSISSVRLDSSTNRNLSGVESREEGALGAPVVRRYVLAAGGTAVVAVIAVLFALEQGARVFNDTWVGVWFSDRFSQGVWFYLGIYAAGGLCYSAVTYARTLRFYYSTVDAATSLHHSLLRHLLRLPKSFFDTNPAGRILNRFSRDTEIMDSVLGQSTVQFLTCMATYVAVFVVISVTTRWFAIAVVPITIIYTLLQRYYIPSARELQRIESVLRSPIYSKFSEALAGVAVIRAYGREGHFTEASDALMEENAFAYVTQKAAASWLSLRLDVIGLSVLVLSAVLCIQGAVSPGLAGLTLVYALELTRYLKHGTAMASKTESDFNSVERVVQYLEPTPEADPDTPDPDLAKELAARGWPEKGAVAVRDLTLRYRPGLPLVLRGLTFDVAGGEKVGLVGRTGSGKSSVFMALFRMVEPSGGSILIDGVDITRVGLKTLRGAMSIIPQDPFMFSGTVRHNLDPFAQCADADLWRALERVGLKPAISGLEAKLDAPVVDHGANFSQGQRQLFCMARAMLRASRVLMLDEATASVDPETDALIQRAVDVAFEGCTTLTIAHRLNTIVGHDRVLVLERGRLTEDGEPHALLAKDGGLFSSMVSQTGAASSRYLRDAAREASVTRQRSRVASASALSVAGGGRVQSEVIGRPYNTGDVGGGAGAAAGGALAGAGSGGLGARVAAAVAAARRRSTERRRSSAEGAEAAADAAAATERATGQHAYDLRQASMAGGAAGANPMGAAWAAPGNLQRQLEQLREAHHREEEEDEEGEGEEARGAGQQRPRR